jgi:hypothetical protein
VPKPYPTGDAQRDKQIEELRAKQREELKAIDPAAKLRPLSADVKPGRLADC